MLVQRAGRLPVPPQAFSASASDTARPKNLYIREDRILPRLPALYLIQTTAEPVPGRRRRRARTGTDVQRPASEDDMIVFLLARQITLTYDPGAGTLQAATPEAVSTVISIAS